MKDIKQGFKEAIYTEGDRGHFMVLGGRFSGEAGINGPEIQIWYVSDDDIVTLYRRQVLFGNSGTAGLIIGKTTGYQIIPDELAPWNKLTEVELFNHIWGPKGEAIKNIYMNASATLNQLNCQFSIDGFPTHYRMLSGDGNSTEMVPINGLVFKDHMSKENAFDANGLRNQYGVNWFPDVDSTYLEHSNPGRLDELYAVPTWSTINDWILETAPFYGFGSNYYRDPIAFDPANFLGYTKTVDYTRNPVTGLAWNLPPNPEKPEVKITNFWDVTQTSARFSIEIVKSGGAVIDIIGAKIGTSNNIAQAVEIPPQWWGSMLIQSLTPGTQYYIWAYARNQAGEFITSPSLVTTQQTIVETIPTIQTGEAVNISKLSAQIPIDVVKDGGLPVTEYGICYNTSPNPTTASSKISFVVTNGAWYDRSAILSALNPGVTYYVRAYAINSKGTAYGAERVFDTLSGIELAGATMKPTTSIVNTSATLNAEMIHNGGDTGLLQVGFIYDTVYPFSISKVEREVNAAVQDTNITYNNIASDLAPGTKYYVSAYVTNSAGTFISTPIEFKTTASAVPVIPEIEIAEPTLTPGQTSVNIPCRVLSDGGSAITVKGVAWSASNQTPTPALATKTQNGADGGYFIASVVGLKPDTTYYVVAYAENEIGVATSTVLTFKTKALDQPILTAPLATRVKDSSAEMVASIVTSGGAEIAEKGFVVSSTITQPSLGSVGSTQIRAGSGAGAIFANIAGLEPGGTYYVRAYVFTSQGTYYGSPISLTTQQYIEQYNQPEVDTWSITKGGFINRVLLIMNEAGMADVDGASFLGANNANIDRYIEGSFENAWRMLATVVPKAWLNNRPFNHYPTFSNLADGTGHIIIPHDFYLLSKFKLQGWQKPIFEAAIEDERVSAIQSNRWTRGSVIRPAGVITEMYIEGKDIPSVTVGNNHPKRTLASPAGTIYFLVETGAYFLSDSDNIFRGVFDPAVEYDVFAMVIYNGELYASMGYSNKGTTPGTNPSKWRKLEKLKVAIPGVCAVLKYYSLPSGLTSHTIEEAVYVPSVTPLSELDSSAYININQRIIEPLAYVTAAAVFTIFEKDKLATSLTEKGLTMIPGHKSVKGSNITFKQ